MLSNSLDSRPLFLKRPGIEASWIVNYYGARDACPTPLPFSNEPLPPQKARVGGAHC